VLAIAQWLLARGVPSPLVGAMLRHQMLPHIVVHASSVCAPIKGRSRGGLTGSRTAGALGRIPVEDVIQFRAAQWSSWGFQAGPNTLTVASFVDNIYAVGSTLMGATRILDDFERHLWERWACKIKPSSRSCMVAYGGGLAVSRHVWLPSRSMQVLGHTISDDGSTSACVEQTFVLMWRAFFANCSCRDAKLLDFDRKMAILKRTTVPILMYRLTRWPCKNSLENLLEQHQRRMVSLLLRVPRLPNEAIDCRRRGRVSAQKARSMGLWSKLHVDRVLAWAARICNGTGMVVPGLQSSCRGMGNNGFASAVSLCSVLRLMLGERGLEERLPKLRCAGTTG